MSRASLSRVLQYRRQRVLLIWAALLLGAVAYVALTSLYQAAREPLLRVSDVLIPRSIDVLIAGWLFYVGSSVGSFLNVVAWRMPRNVSINGRSHCPWCDQTLSWRDNWPVFGWLALGGRCSGCRLPISARYPIVELVVGLSLLVIGWREIMSGGGSLPFHPSLAGRVGYLYAPRLSQLDVLTVVYHLVGASAAWALGLVRFDGHRLPRRLVVTCFALVIIPMLVTPAVAVVPWHVTMDERWSADGQFLDAAMRVITGLVAAVIIGRALARYLSPSADPKLDPLGQGTARLLDLIAMLAVPGVMIGWQALLATTALAIALAWAVPVARFGRLDPLAKLAIALPIALTIQLCLWRILHQTTYWPSINTEPTITLVWAIALLFLPRLLIEADDPPAVATAPAEEA